MAVVGPAAPTTFIARPRLHAELVGWRSLRLICVVAPTGYGKSTFIAWWVNSLVALPEMERPAVVWLWLEPAAPPLDVALQRLAETLRPHLPSIEALLERHAAGRLSAAQLAQILCTDIGRLSQDFIFVVDDFHLTSEPTMLELLQGILDSGPPNLHLVLLSRTQPSLKIGRLLLKNAALLINESQLRFDHDEFLAFVRATRLSSLDAAQRDAVEARCEGWVAALQLLALSLPKSIDDLLGPRSGHLLLAHLEEEVLAHLPAELQQFLVDIAPLPFLTIDLIAAASRYDKHAASRLLQRALDANIFLTADSHPPTHDASQTRYRFHSLFRELLLHKLLDAGDPIAGDRTMRRAADWLAAQGEIDAALDLLLPDHPAVAIDTIAAHLRPAILRFDLISAQRWLNRLPAQSIDSHPSLAVDAAWISMLSHGRDLTMRIAAARTALTGRSDAEQAAEIDVLHAFALYLNSQCDAARRAAAAIHLPRADAGMAAGYFHMLQALLHDQPDHLDVRLRELKRAGEIYRSLGLADAALDTQLGACVLERRAGRSLAAVSAYEHALALIRHFGRENSGIAVSALIQFGEHLYLMDRIPAARTQFEHAIAITDRFASMSVDGYRARLGLQLCMIAEGSGQVAIDEEDDARRWAAVIADHPPLFTVSIAWARFLRDIRMERLDRARRTVDVFGMQPNHLAADAHEYLRLLILAGAVLTDAPDARLTDTLLAFRAEMHATQNTIVAAYATSLLALHFLRLGDEQTAHIEAHAARQDAERLLMPRLLTDFSQHIAPSESPDAFGDSVEDAPFGLSRQEMRVLTMLADDCSNKEIAAALSVSLPTVKTHIQHIFRKLDVHTRADAVRAVQAARAKT